MTEELTGCVIQAGDSRKRRVTGRQQAGGAAMTEELTGCVIQAGILVSDVKQAATTAVTEELTCCVIAARDSH